MYCNRRFDSTFYIRQNKKGKRLKICKNCCQVAVLPERDGWAKKTLGRKQKTEWVQHFGALSTQIAKIPRSCQAWEKMRMASYTLAVFLHAFLKHLVSETFPKLKTATYFTFLKWRSTVSSFLLSTIWRKGCLNTKFSIITPILNIFTKFSVLISESDTWQGWS